MGEKAPLTVFPIQQFISKDHFITKHYTDVCLVLLLVAAVPNVKSRVKILRNERDLPSRDVRDLFTLCHLTVVCSCARLPEEFLTCPTASEAWAKKKEWKWNREKDGKRRIN